MTMAVSEILQSLMQLMSGSLCSTLMRELQMSLPMKLRSVLRATENVLIRCHERITLLKKVLHGVMRPDKVERLLKRGLFYEGVVHERLHSPYDKKLLKGRLIHFPYKSWEAHLEK